MGIANLVASYIQSETGCSAEESRKNIWLLDSKGLVSSARTDTLAHHKRPYAHELPSSMASAVAAREGDGATVETDVLLQAVRGIAPSALVGVSAQGGSFTEAVCKAMAANNASPLIFALSNPTSKAECTAGDAYHWTDGTCSLSVTQTVCLNNSIRIVCRTMRFCKWESL